MGGIDQEDVREGLREVAQLTFAARIVFLREQTDVVAQADEAFEDGASNRS
jgi:hypothetical protein